jgi:hypothetical protein
MRMALAGLIATLVFASAASAQQPPPPVEADPNPPAWVVVPRATAIFATVDGKVESDEASFPAPILDGTSVRFDSDLNLDDEDPVWLAEIVAFQRIGGLYLEQGSLSWLEASYEGAATLDQAEIFNGRTFGAGTTVESKVHYRSWGADYAVFTSPTIFPNTSGSFLLGARYTDLRVQMEGAGGETDERVRLFYFGGGLRGETRVANAFTGVLQGAVYFSGGGFDDWGDEESEEWGGVIFEGLAGVTVTAGPIRAEGGWRYLSNSSYSDHDSTDKFEENDFLFELNGPYFSLTFRF